MDMDINWEEGDTKAPIIFHGLAYSTLQIANGDVSSSAVVSGSIDRSISPGPPLIGFDHSVGTSIASHSGRALQLPQLSTNNFSEIMEQLQADMDTSPPKRTDLDDWGK